MQYFLDVLKNKYALFNGRARRAEFWQFYLFFILTVMAFGFIGGMIRVPAIVAIPYLGLIVPYIAVGVRRMHDVGKSGWFLLIPFYNLILAVTEGEKSTNEYGPDPKSAANDFVSTTL